MAQTQPNHPLPGAEEIQDWMKDWSERVLPHMPPEWRVAGLNAEERLAGLTAEELLSGLSSEERARLKALLNKNVKD